MRRLLAGLSFLLIATGARAEPIAITASPIETFQRLSSTERFGPFAWRGGLTISSPAEKFGGFSGLVLGHNCDDLLAVSDSGNWLTGKLNYESARLAGFSEARMFPLLSSKGKPLEGKYKSDAEALMRLPDGKLLVAFESFVRFGSYADVRARFHALPHPKDIDAGPSNGEVEAAGALPGGRLIAIAEKQFASGGAIHAWAWKGAQAVAFTLERFGEYRVTDLAVLADGSVLTLERRFSATSLPGMAVRRFPSIAIRAGATIAPELLLEATAPLHVIDNMEGIAACTRDGETRVTLISDDNFNRSVQSTILLQFAYRP